LELSTITRIEQFLCDALIASPLIPIGVNVLRLADVIDKEGVINQTNNIVVRYTGASNKVKNRIPMVFERSMRFELNFSCQNYLTSSGHDFATQLLAGAFITLNGSVPGGAYVQVIEPFVCVSESFTGLTDQSQYTYTQEYELQIEEAMPYVALDPCVQRGDCRQVFPATNVDTRLPLGGVLEETTGDIYVPNRSEDGPDENPQGIRWSNEDQGSGDWVFVCDPELVYMQNPLAQGIYILSNDSFTEDGRLVVTIWNGVTNTPIRNEFYVNTGKKLARYAMELWRNTINGSKGGGIDPDSVKEATFTSKIITGELAVVRGAFKRLYSNPLIELTSSISLTGGTLVGIDVNTFVQTPAGRFFYVAQSPQGKGWLPENSFTLAQLNSLWKLGCPSCSDELC
jgi:hypothetical protein